ncbi:MAG: ATP-dependent helicase [Patescibacteria group bacterium]|nr:ATP-dependent helicase [Patescibacteria group bacterium]
MGQSGCIHGIIPSMTQTEALDIMKLGHNVFLTGAAGTGKTYVLNEFIKYLQKHSINHTVTASTGLAATHIGGITIHSFSGIGIKNRLSTWDIEILTQNEKLNKRINNIKVIIIDEISMLHASRLDMIDSIFKAIRKDRRPFGGVQMIFCGDFFQLPPVIKKNELEESNKTIEQEYAFNAISWKEAKPVICYLSENYRQEDNTLSNILNMIRAANEDLYESLESLNGTRDNVLDNSIKLYSHNKNVDEINIENYNNLDSDITEVEYIMKSRGKKNLIDNLKQNILALESIKLKKDTKVIFIKNDREGKYQNGTLGIVKGFDKDNYPIITDNKNEEIIAKEENWQLKDEDENVLAEVSQLPLRYAWAITIHKSQGMTLDAAEIDLSNGFGFGMGYVALSRVRSLSGLKLHGLNNQSLMVANNVLAFDKVLREKSKNAKSALIKYQKEELEAMHIKSRLQMGGLEKSISDQELQRIKEENTLKEKQERMPTQSVTLSLIREYKSVKEIAKERNLTINTILDHIQEITELTSYDSDTELKENITKIVEQYLKEYIKNQSISKEFLKKKNIINIKKAIQENEGKLKPVLEKYKIEYKDLDYVILKLIKII